MIIIAEIGINHNGNLNLAHEMIREARISGADIAKFQFYDPEKLFGLKGSHPDKVNFEFAKKIQFGFDEAKQLKQWCDEENIEFSASVFDIERVEWMESLKMKRYKIASRSVEDKELCQKIFKTGKEAFISLGFWKGKGIPYDYKNAKYLYCVPKYPCEYKDIKMPEDFTGSIYNGFSDHLIGLAGVLSAVARGASVIEKHFTLHKGLEGPDHICSMTPDELKILNQYGRQMESFLKFSGK